MVSNITLASLKDVNYSKKPQQKSAPAFCAEQKKDEFKKAKITIANGWSLTAGYKKFSDTFSDEDVKKYNEKRKLPEGYYLVGVPKAIIVDMTTGMPMDENPANIQMLKLKDERVAKLKHEGAPITNKIPSDFEIVNENGKTYIKEKKLESVSVGRQKVITDNLTESGVICGAFALIMLVCKCFPKK